MANRRTFFFDGLGVSSGIAIGPAYVIEASGVSTEPWRLSEAEVGPEIERLRQALKLAEEEIRAIRREVEEKIDRQQAAIFDAHLLILEDPILVNGTIERIRSDRQNAEHVFWSVAQGLSEMMTSLGDAYFAERNHDLVDVARRVVKFLGQLSERAAVPAPREGSIIVAHNLGPAETAQFSREHVLGFCTNEGGPTSHTAIMAKALAIPAVVGLEYVTHYIRTGDTLILDGAEGKLILNPTPDLLESYRARATEFSNFRHALDELRHLPAITTDGHRVRLMANIEYPYELDSVEQNGAEGIGLFRTEFLFLDRVNLPTEDEQVEEYRYVLDRMKDHPVVIRTLDIGGDKLPLEEYHQHEANPFLGLRAIRMCLGRPELMRSQLRAMLRAAAGRPVQVMIPMVSSLDEVRATRGMIDRIRAQMLEREEPVATSVSLGAMIEIPSAALQAADLAGELEFFSIGTNDLVQYTLAVDRVNKSVAHLYRPAHPAVLRLIRMVSEAGAAAGIPVSVCGEMASDPRYAILLMGMGISTLSMGPSSIGLVKQAIRRVSLADAKALAQEVLPLATVTQVETCLQQRLGELLDRISDSSPRAAT